MSELPARQRRRLVTGALLLDASATFPAAIAGAVSVFIREDLGVTDQQFGFALAASFLSGAVTVLVVGRVLDALGWERLIVIAAALGVSGLVGASVAVGAVSLTLALTLSGAGVALMMPATNLLLVAVDGPARLATLLAIKQTSVPIALFVAGFAAPPLLLVADWRALFLIAVGAGPVGIGLVRRFSNPSGRGTSLGVMRPRSPTRNRRAAVSARKSEAGGGDSGRGLGSTTVGVTLSSSLPGALAAYLVISLVASEVDSVRAALIFGGSNVIGIAMRISAGVYATRVGSTGFVPVASMMCLGGLGALLLSAESPLFLIVGSTLAFSLGWGWPGLLFFAVMQARPESPGRASAAVHAGGLLGAGMGPIVAGAIGASFGWDAMWAVIGALSVVGAGFVLVAARSLGSPAVGGSEEAQSEIGSA